MTRRLIPAFAVLPLTCMPVFAQSMQGMPIGQPTPDLPPSTKAYRDAMTTMDMSITYLADADKDFVADMIPHHQGAINMAQVELQYGKDPERPTLARDIIRAQQKEIAFMNAWQAKHAR